LIPCVCILLLLFSCEGKAPPPDGKPEAPPLTKAIVEREKTEREEPLSPEVKIRLRRDGKGSYTWEISGSDVNQILKANERLRKQLEGERPQ
jgi:hypothetical protein